MAVRASGLAHQLTRSTTTVATTGGTPTPLAATLSNANGLFLAEVVVKFSAAPTTSESITYSISDGTYSHTPTPALDPSATASAEVSWRPVGLFLDASETLTVAFANTDDRDIECTFRYAINPEV